MIVDYTDQIIEGIKPEDEPKTLRDLWKLLFD